MIINFWACPRLKKPGSGYSLYPCTPITIGVHGYSCYPSRDQGNILLKSRHKDRRNPPFWEGQFEKMEGMPFKPANKHKRPFISITDFTSRILILDSWLYHLDTYVLLLNTNFQASTHNSHFALHLAAKRRLTLPRPANPGWLLLSKLW